ncbi:hypothetical protein [Dyella silvatica]|uniref:hypothetical protein n=1 Tax=Dyella silvatica TaxID=2992128 RepID=UPI002251BE51|nr:hypothetical protein [Dyella silvatica]
MSEPVDAVACIREIRTRDAGKVAHKAAKKFIDDSVDKKQTKSNAKTMTYGLCGDLFRWPAEDHTRATSAAFDQDHLDK